MEVGGRLRITAASAFHAKVTEDGTRAIKFENVAVSATVDEAALKPPAP